MGQILFISCSFTVHGVFKRPVIGRSSVIYFVHLKILQSIRNIANLGGNK